MSCVLGLCASTAAAPAGNVIHVSPAGNDNSSGLSWAVPKRTVTAGLAAAVAGDQVWVAAGTYVECITLKADVELYGGFAGTETSLTERPPFPRTAPDANETILDGNYGGSVVTSPSGATTTTRIDGFTIRNGSGTVVGAYRYGGGIYCSYSSPAIVSNTIIGNTISGASVVSHK